MLWKAVGSVFLLASLGALGWVSSTSTLYSQYGWVVLASLIAHGACSLVGDAVLQYTMGKQLWLDLIDEDKGGSKSMHYRAVNTLGSFMHAVISGSLTVAAYSMHPKLLLEFWQPEFYGSSKLCPIVALSAAVTLGYLVIDTWHTVYHGYAPVKVPILVHHICMSTGVSLMLYYDVAMPYLAMGLACELQSSFMHLWWLMSTHRWHLGHFLPKVIWLTIAITYIFTRYAAHGIMAYCGLFLSQTWKPVLASHGAPEALGWMAGVAFSGFTYLNLVLHLDLWGRFKRDSKEATFLMKVEAAVDEEAREALWQDKWREMRERKEQKKQARARAKAEKGGSKK